MNWKPFGGIGGLVLRTQASFWNCLDEAQSKALRCLLLAALAVVLGATGVAAPADDLVQACAAGDVRRVTALLQTGAKVNEPDAEGRLPLLAALFSKKEDVVRLLLTRGADPNQIGRCPEKRCTSHPSLAFAAHLDQPRLVSLLLNAKADIAFKDHLATRQANVDRHMEVYKILRTAGGRPFKSPEGETKGEVAAKPAISMGVNELLTPTAQPAKAAGAKLRLAIIADTETQEAADLLTAELSGSFNLVERNELDRVLNEQQLSRDLTPDGANVQKLGALLGADAIALMRKIELSGTALLEVRLVRVSPGIILDTSHQALPLQEPARWAKASATRLTALSGKVRNARAIAVSPADFRPASNTPAAVTFARQAALLVSDQFIRRNDVVVLERAALAELKGERALSRSGPFWAGSYLVDGTAEAPLDSKGVATLTLRLQPMDGKAPLTFTAKGAMAQMKTLVEQLVAQAGQALALQPAPAMNAASEAQRYFAESRAAHQRSLFLVAHRAAETAALLGLDSEEFREWRLKAALSVISWQTEMMCGSNGYEAVRWAGWNPAWINERMGGAEWLPLAQWLELAPTTLELWREMLSSALESGNLERVQKAMDLEKDVVGSYLGIWFSANLAETLLQQKAQLDALPVALRKVYEEALAIADRRPELAPAQALLARRLAVIAGAAYPAAADYTAAMKGLLARRFAVNDRVTRIAIRRSAVALDHQVSMPVYKRTATGFGAIAYGYAPAPATMATAPAVFADLRTSKAPEDALACELVRFRLTKQPAERVAISERIFTQLWELRQLFVDEPDALDLFDTIAIQLRADAANAPKFANLNRDPDGGRIVHTPEMLELRRKLFLFIAENAAAPRRALRLYDEDYHPANEDAAKVEALRAKLLAGPAEQDRGKLTQATPQPVIASVQPSGPASKTPSYGAAPPLEVSITWVPEKFAPDVIGLSMLPQNLVMEGEHVWLSATDTYTQAAFLFRVEIPSMQTEVWKLPAPKTKELKSDQQFGATTLLIDPDYVFVARGHTYLAAGNRKTKAWETNEELQPKGPIVRIGADLFFLTEQAGARGLVQYTHKPRKTELLASNRRVPAQSPLDDAKFEAVHLTVANKELQVIVQPAKVGTAGESGAGAPTGARSVITYDPAKKAWSGPKPQEHPAGPKHLTAPGFANCYPTQGGLWTLQLPQAEMPKARFPLTLAQPRTPEEDSGKLAANGPASYVWYWTGKGYLIFEQASFKPAMWYLPYDEVTALMNGHEPTEGAPATAAR